LLCRVEDKEKIERLLFDAYLDYKREGFPDPALQGVIPNLGLDGLHLTFEGPTVFTGITIEPQDSEHCVGASGYYTPGLMNLVFCGDTRRHSEAALKFVVRHELFHAFQFAYPNVATTRAAWVVEGTATAAAAWNGMMNRAHGPLHPANISMLSEVGNAEYLAQDFWVHLFTSTSPEGGARRALPLGTLDSLFERGASTQNVADELQSSANYAPLSEEYWAWAKNQVFEKTDVTFAEPGLGDVLSNPCSLEPKLIDVRGPFVNDGFGGQNIVSGYLSEPLQSTVVRIRFPTGAAGVVVHAEGDEGLRYEIYMKNETGDCWSRPSNVDREFYAVQPGANVYVLLANTRHEAGSLEYTVTVSPVE
jgi:hypothetical protein